jgi:DNA-directed RNA polymerase subunit N
MLIPVRCFTCGELIGDKYAEFVKRVDAGETPGTVLDDMGFKRYCCRRMFLTNVDIVDQVFPYHEALARRRAEFEGNGI